VVELVLGIPGAAGNFFGGREIVQHVELLRLGRDGFDGLDQSAGLQLLRRGRRYRSTVALVLQLAHIRCVNSVW
jgi:hypothetical protein